MRFIGRRLWKAFEKMLLAGGRAGNSWADLKTRMQLEVGQNDA
jgi:hypothetical protein